MRNGIVQQHGGQDKIREKERPPRVPCNTRQEAALSQYALHVNELRLLTTDDTRRSGMQQGKNLIWNLFVVLA